MTAEQRVRDILAASGQPELAQEGTGRRWRVTRPGWHVFTYQGAVRIDWWSEHTLDSDWSARQCDRDGLAALRSVLEDAGLAVTSPDESVLEVVPAGPAGYYVTVKDGPRWGTLLGPYATRAEAEENVPLGKKLAEQVNDRAIWYAYGVTRVTMQPGADLPAGKLNGITLKGDA